MIGETYMTRGKQSPEVPPGIYEGEFNRDIARMLHGFFRELGEFDSTNLAPGPMSASPLARAKFVNDYIKRTGEKAIYLAIHANASPKPGWSDANGARVFVAPNASKTSVALATSIRKTWGAYDIGIEAPRQVKRAKFTELTRTTCPAVLVECGFMTNKNDALVLADRKLRARIASAIYWGVDAVLSCAK
jgi:N-acetylmuramoyl-L-alanine amidase